MKLVAELVTEGLENQLKALNAALDVEDIADESQAIILNRIRTRFLAEEGPEGKWKPSKAAIKRRAAGGTGTLFKTGTLFHSLQAYKEGEGERRFSTDVPYGKYHQFGQGDNRRQFLFFTDNDIGVVEKLIRKRVKEALA